MSTLSAGCFQYIPGRTSPKPEAASLARLRAGFARVDITPPPGASLFGYGPESKLAQGHRQRLHARAMVLEDRDGERIAIVTAELGAVSALLQRRISELTRGYGIGTDRLILAATHTHAGPTHFFGLAYDQFSGEMKYGGYDEAWTRELAHRIAAAVNEATRTMRPARAQWISFPIWGVTFNRAIVPYRRNHPKWEPPFPPETALSEEERAVDPTWRMLRVDVQQANGEYRPAGAFSIFAVHGTGIPSANDLYDSDLHGLISKELERRWDERNSESNPNSRSVHLFANGAQGDVTAMPASTRCALPAAGPQVDTTNTVKAMLSHDWIPVAEDSARACIDRSITHMRAVSRRIVDAVDAHFSRMQPNDSLLMVRVAFRTIEPPIEDGFCPVPRVGSATLAGPLDGHTRQYAAGVRHVTEGGTAAMSTPRRFWQCHWPKRILAGDLVQNLILDIFPLPLEAQLAAIRIGDRMLVTVPWEVSTTAGGRIGDTIAKELELPRDQVGVIALVNGYLQYLTTPEEYHAQHYEGASNIYGPNTSTALRHQLLSLSRTIRGSAPSPRPSLRKLIIHPTIERDAVPMLTSQAESNEREITLATCVNGIVRVHWSDSPPGRLLRNAFPLVEMQTRDQTGDWRTAALDDDLALEMRWVGNVLGEHVWEAVWRPAVLPPELRFVLPARTGRPELTRTFSCL